MKYFNDEDILLSDFDGVLLDTITKFKEVMKDDKCFDNWNNYLNTITWQSFYKSCDFIPNALESLTELEKLNILKGFLTKIHSLTEGEEKIKFIRKVGFKVPIYLVMPKQKKSEVYIPNNHTILLDDYYGNYNDWTRSGGKALLYKNGKNKTKKKVIRDMKDLMR